MRERVQIIPPAPPYLVGRCGTIITQQGEYATIAVDGTATPLPMHASEYRRMPQPERIAGDDGAPE